MKLEELNNVLVTIADWSIPTFILIIVVYAALKGVKIYEEFVQGAKEGFQIAVVIMPYLVAILVAIGMVRDVGLIDVFAQFLNPFTSHMFLPAECIPMAIMRPLSGSGALGTMNDIFFVYGPDSYQGILASVLYGCTETTFYVLAVYFGAVNISKSRHAVAAGIIGDIAGILFSVLLTYLFFSKLYPV